MKYEAFGSGVPASRFRSPSLRSIEIVVARLVNVVDITPAAIIPARKYCGNGTRAPAGPSISSENTVEKMTTNSTGNRNVKNTSSGLR